MHLKSFESTREARGTRLRLVLLLTLLSCSPNFPRASITLYRRTLTMDQFVIKKGNKKTFNVIKKSLKTLKTFISHSSFLHSPFLVLVTSDGMENKFYF